jgi:NadR type nicotinamide-nucleotide adenylyltransferase
MSKIKKVAVLGPESTGKTQLCMELAAHFKTEWVPEFARAFLVDNNYSYEDVAYCLEQQVVSEEKIFKSAHRFLFCDTELINFKVWFSDVFKEVPVWLDGKIRTHQYDLTLLTNNDVPFEEDILRVNADRRDFFFDWYKRELEHFQKPYAVISGLGSSRTEHAIAAIEKLSS